MVPCPLLELNGLVEKCGVAVSHLQEVEMAPVFSPEEKKEEMDFVELHDEGKGHVTR
jgi:hypothetical protein